MTLITPDIFFSNYFELLVFTLSQLTESLNYKLSVSQMETFGFMIENGLAEK